MSIKDELVHEICAKSGLDQATAMMAVNAAIDFLKTKLPAPIAMQVDGFLAGTGEMPGLGNIGGMLGGLFGGQR